jgi:hypothetical protein
VQPSEQSTHHRELLRTVGQPGPLDELRDENRAAVEVRHRIIDREALSRIVLILKEPQDRGVALNPGTRAGGRKRAGGPRLVIPPVDPKDVALVHTQLRRSDSINAVAIPQVNQQPLGDRFVIHSRTKALEICQRFGVALPGLLGIAADNPLEAGVLRHRQAPP